MEQPDLSYVDEVLNRYKGHKGTLITVLQQVQAHKGYLEKEALERVARSMGVPTARIYGVVTFYAQFRLTPVGKHLIRVCHGTACHVQNADGLTEAVEGELGLKTGETTPDMLFTVESVACLGCCSLAPVIMVGEKVYGKLSTDKVRKVIKEYKKMEKEVVQ
ncbi:MAG: NADH-quinone oxidoreductase subunit NuoE [Syntrophales bacterium]|jgi:NADH-quinone oxidoreductase subunit E|nr:NADH-quinone oxidoreductase subunit NuoE [Syntrophales bacterium]